MLKRAVANGLARPFSYVCLRCELRLASSLRVQTTPSPRKHVRFYADSTAAAAGHNDVPTEKTPSSKNSTPVQGRRAKNASTQRRQTRPRRKTRKRVHRSASTYRAPRNISTRQELMDEAKKAKSLRMELRKFQKAEALYWSNLKKGLKVRRLTAKEGRVQAVEKPDATEGRSDRATGVTQKDSNQTPPQRSHEAIKVAEDKGEDTSRTSEEDVIKAASSGPDKDMQGSKTNMDETAAHDSSSKSGQGLGNSAIEQRTPHAKAQTQGAADANKPGVGHYSSKSQEAPPTKASLEVESEKSKTAKRRAVRAKTLKEALLAARKTAEKKAQKEQKLEASLDQSISVSDLKLEAINVPQPPVPRLSHGLDRVLFNPGVYHLRDPRSRVYNFDPYLEKIIPVDEFDFNTLGAFMTPSNDPQLARIAQEQSKKYVGSTSSMTGVLKQFHFLLSRFRNLNLLMTSKSFPVSSNQMTVMSRSPDAILLRYRDGSYAIDADKQYDSANVLSLMGKFMERLLTVGKDEFEKHRIGESHRLDAAARDIPEAYHYSTMGDIVVRSQLDAHDPRLPGRGIFDLKTRAVLPIRMDTKDFEWGTDYEIRDLQGQYESFEREYHDMARSTLLKYSLQVRLGRMDGIFVAYHNIKRIFGFQYLSLEEMDKVLHGTTDKTLGDSELLLSLQLMNKVFDKAVEKFPKQTIRFHFEARETTEPFMYVFAEPVSDDEADRIQATNKQKIEEWEANILGRTKPSTLTHASQVTEGDIEQDATSDLLPASQHKRDAESSDKVTSAEKNSVGTDGSGADFASAPDKEVAGESQAPAQLDTGSGAESHFLDTLTSEAEQLGSSLPQTPLLALVVHVKSTVNGKKVPAPPESLSQSDDWTVKYSVAEVTDTRRAWRLYWQCRARRAKAYADEDTDSEHQASASAPPKEDAFMDMLRRVAAEGRQWRTKQDQRDAGQRVRTWDDGGHE